MSRLPLLGAVLILSGCAVGPDYHRPVSEQSEQWQSRLNTVASSQAAGTAAWWQQLDDPLLNELISGAMQHNRDLAGALANIEQARALRRAAGAGYYPTVDSSGSGSRSRFSRQTGFGANIGTRNTFSAGLDASWELDLFGRTRRAVEVADAQIGASEAAHRGVMLSVVAEVATSYFEARGLQRQLTVTERDIELLREVEEIARAQSELGVTTEMDLMRARGERETFEARLPNLEAEIAARSYRISVLTGQPPEQHVRALQESRPLPMPPDLVPVGLRSEILKRRPDVQLAERELAAATAGIGVARADLFPSFSLTGAIGTSARVFSDLFTSGTFTNSVGGALAWPVFAGGALTAGVDVAEAGAKAALARYEQSVLLALEDSEASLMRYGKEWQTLERLRSAEASRQKAFEIARLRYETGEENFLVILDAERDLITTRNDIISSETRILTSLAQLYKALGGGWLPPEN
ncbi:MAG: efflux transporter outer membrane subunit [Mariprofundaceae bacterium]|nr:efflux transporter outer membrane subunit [Mariprofundaceae bacterium]